MKRMKKVLILSSIVLLALFILSQVRISFRDNCFVSKAFCAVTEALKVYVDGKETDLVCKEQKDLYMLPVPLPFKEGENKWEITINYDKESKKVDITRQYHPPEDLLKTRGEDGKVTCVWCGGDGKCHYCTPVGSGVSSPAEGDRCVVCLGSGKCSSCDGTGKTY
ncbi:MAG: hypothetical protein ABRQ37_14810 [Candidatus Eremiobacterota bacterium]